jgi:beta-aspartyl-peptidase (threonine type)
LGAILALSGTAFAGEMKAGSHPIGIVIHGGAGTIRKADMTPALEKQYRDKLTEALTTGYAVLKKGGTSLDAVQAAIMVMEKSPLFNAGKGAVFDHEGHNELDAAIMDGSTLNAGAVAGVQHIASPISLARLVMTRSKHVLLSGAGAEEFAKSQGMSLVSQDYFYTKHRWEQLQKVLERDRKNNTRTMNERWPLTGDEAFGTVGAAALDSHGNLAAGTSTGGLTNKYYGRIGDSPIIGAGTYANNATCAVSATGTGEYFMRLLVTHTISDLMQYKGMSLRQAADQVVMHELVDRFGVNTGGIIAIDNQGHIAMPFNTEGMYRGYIDADGKPVVMMYKDQDGK